MSNKTAHHDELAPNNESNLSIQTYKLSYSNFLLGIEELSKFFYGGQIYKTKINNDSSSFFLHEWKLNHDSYEGYLSHPPFLQRVFKNNNKNSEESDQDECWDDYEDENVIVEDPDIVANTLCRDENLSDYEDIEWSFSIAYSHVWSMPILYFQVCQNDGTFMTRKHVLKIINDTQQQNYDDDNSNSSVHGVKDDEMGNDTDGQWNFISQEEHPITGRPSYFFHPCQTACRMQLIYPNKEMMSSNPGKWILTWMSMILPSAGFRILPQMIQAFNDNSIHTG